jgi:hypothetical protein
MARLLERRGILDRKEFAEILEASVSAAEAGGYLGVSPNLIAFRDLARLLRSEVPDGPDKWTAITF